MATVRAAALPYGAQKTAAIPWYVWTSALAVTSSMVGGHWDIAWHRSIGRDTFWTPAHLAIYACGVIAGLTSAWLILSATFRRDTARTVGMWGFRGPLGAFISAWGGAAMLTSAPFDDWWHSAYGLDVKVLSPPHILLLAGILGVQLGGLVLMLGEMNRAEGRQRRRLTWLFLYVAGMIVVMMNILVIEYTTRTFMHSAMFYRTMALAIPAVIVAARVASGHRWAASAVAGVYTLFLIGLIWILPLFPAEPKLGPVHVNVTHFIPPGFPVLIIAPAIAIDLLWRRIGGWNRWKQAGVAGVVFVAALLAVQWPFADFLQSPWARNWIFGAHYLDYNVPATTYTARFQFYPWEKSGVEFSAGVALAFLAAILTTRLGIACGAWMTRVRR